MSQQPAQPEYTTINGVRYKLTKCNRCTGSFEIYLINKESDRNKPATWEVHNKDGSAHLHDKKSSSGWASKPPALKSSVSISKIVAGTTITLQTEFIKTETPFDNAYEEVRAKLDEWAKKAVIQP